MSDDFASVPQIQSDGNLSDLDKLMASSPPAMSFGGNEDLPDTIAQEDTQTASQEENTAGTVHTGQVTPGSSTGPTLRTALASVQYGLAWLMPGHGVG